MSIIKDGKGTTLTFGTNTEFVLEKTKIKALGLKGGGKIDLTHLGNSAWRTFSPKSLKECEDIDFTAHYDPDLCIAAPINVNQKITIRYPSGKAHFFYGYLDELVGGDIVEGNKVECTGKIIITNVNAGTETGPSNNS